MDVSKQNESSGEGTTPSGQEAACSNRAAMDVKHQKPNVSTDKKTLRQEAKNKSSDTSDHELEAKMGGWEVEEIILSAMSIIKFAERSKAYLAKSSGNQK